jgi:hypothetical protein
LRLIVNDNLNFHGGWFKGKAGAAAKLKVKELVGEIFEDERTPRTKAKPARADLF